MSSYKRAAILSIAVALALFAAVRWFGAPSDARAINLRLQSFALNLNPLALADTESRRVATLLHLGLVRVNHDGSVAPGLASEWKSVGTTTTFKLKAGASFADGTPITAEVVRDSLCRSMQPAAVFSWSLASIEHSTSPDGKVVSCSGIVAVGTLEIMVTESVPKPWLLEALAGPGGWVTKDGVTSQYGNTVGAGPYVLHRVEPDSRVVLVSRQGGPLAARAAEVVFTLITDDAQAATAYKAGRLDVIEVTSPNLARLLGISSLSAGDGSSLNSVESDRLRILIVNKSALSAKKFDASQIRALMHLIDKGFDRTQLVEPTLGLAVPIGLPFPFGAEVSAPPGSNVTQALPPAALTVITESDYYSDFVASRIPKVVGEAVRIDYKGIDKGLLIDRIVKKDFDLASVTVEGTLHAPEFWFSFFQPGSPFSAFGEPLEDLRQVRFDSADQRRLALGIIAYKGNWIGLVRERNVIVSRQGISGLRFTPAGQASYESIGRQQ